MPLKGGHGPAATCRRLTCRPNSSSSGCCPLPHTSVSLPPTPCVPATPHLSMEPKYPWCLTDQGLRPPLSFPPTCCLPTPESSHPTSGTQHGRVGHSFARPCFAGKSDTQECTSPSSSSWGPWFSGCCSLLDMLALRFISTAVIKGEGGMWLIAVTVIALALSSAPRDKPLL